MDRPISYTEQQLQQYQEIESFVNHIIKGKSNHEITSIIDKILGKFQTLVDDPQFENFLEDVILPNWIRRLEEKRQLSDERGKQISLREHCYVLHQAIVAIKYDGYYVDELMERDGELISWESAAEWLDIASGVERVEVNTLYFDRSVWFCSSARRYENSRSDILSHFATQFTIFNYVWGCLESIIKLIEPPKVPKTVKPGRSSPIDKAMFFLKTEYEPSQRPLTFYDETVASMRDILKDLPHYMKLTGYFRLENHVGVSGVGINVVRKIRNRFAHGATSIPEPSMENERGLRSKDSILIELSTRVILYTIQMLLLAFLKSETFNIDILLRDEDFASEHNIHEVLRFLHLKKPVGNENQLEPPLFEE